jgi:hypothetical protein
MPFGLDLAPWDVLLTDVELERFFMQLNVVNTSQQTMLALVVHFADAGRVKAAMEAAGYQSVHPFYVYKPSQNVKGTDCFIFAVEMILIGYLGGSRDRGLVFGERNPVGRHNLLFGHNVGSRYQLSGQGEPVNTCQKHPGIAHHLATICARPGSNALVIGSGSGSDVVGCLRAGLNVVAIDKDSKQFQGCKARLLGYIADVEEEKKKEALELAQVQHLKEVARCMAAWTPEDAAAEEVEALVAIVQPEDAAPQPPVLDPAGKSKDAKCIACGQHVDLGEAKSCMRDQCTTGKVLHQDCVKPCMETGCNGEFCCQRHLEEHQKEVHA